MENAILRSKKRFLSKIMLVMDLNSRKDNSRYCQCIPLNLSKQFLHQSVMCAHLTMTQVDNLTESSEKIKVFAQKENPAKESLPDIVFKQEVTILRNTKQSSLYNQHQQLKTGFWKQLHHPTEMKSALNFSHNDILIKWTAFKTISFNA